MEIGKFETAATEFVFSGFYTEIKTPKYLYKNCGARDIFNCIAYNKEGNLSVQGKTLFVHAIIAQATSI